MLNPQANVSIYKFLIKNKKMNEAWLLTLSLFKVSSKLSLTLFAGAQGLCLLPTSCKTKLYVQHINFKQNNSAQPILCWWAWPTNDCFLLFSMMRKCFPQSFSEGVLGAQLHLTLPPIKCPLPGFRHLAGNQNSI